MIKKCIWQKINVVKIYCKVQMYFLNDSNNYKTWWSTLLYIEYEFIVPFQLQLQSLAHVITQKSSRQDFHSNEHKCIEKKTFGWKIIFT
jgi:hypothetical protein